MSEYSRVQDVIGKIEEREQIHGLIEPKHRPAAKYKKGPKDKVERPALKVGKKVVFNIGQNRWSKHPLKGYALGVILDWGGDETGWNSARLIVQVIRVSNPELGHLVGHLRAVSIGGYYQSPTAPMPFLVPEEGDPKDYKL